jgi:hypothetical protein
LTNEEASYRYWREQARRHREEARKQFLAVTYEWPVVASVKLGEQIRAELEEGCPIKEPSVYDDLMRAAAEEVNWEEVAEAFLQEVADEEPTREEDDDQAEEEDEEAYSAEEFERLTRERRESTAGPLFELGQVVSTPGALEALTREEMSNALARHHRGDWGEVGRHDWRENELSLREGFRLFSVYRSEKGEKFWVITEADRSVTTVLLPSEY